MNPGTVSLEKFTKRRASAAIAASEHVEGRLSCCCRRRRAAGCAPAAGSQPCAPPRHSHGRPRTRRPRRSGRPASNPRARPGQRAVPGRNRQISGAHVMAGDLQARDEGPTDLAPRAPVTRTLTRSEVRDGVGDDAKSGPRRKSRSQPSLACSTCSARAIAGTRVRPCAREASRALGAVLPAPPRPRGDRASGRGRRGGSSRRRGRAPVVRRRPTPGRRAGPRRHRTCRSSGRQRSAGDRSRHWLE